MVFITDILSDAFLDSAKLVPVLFITYLIVEYFEHSDISDINARLHSRNRSKTFIASLFGLFPQCGVSVVAVSLFDNGILSPRCLIAVFLACSDEAFPYLLASGRRNVIPALLCVKFVSAVIWGYALEKFIHESSEAKPQIPENEWHQKKHKHTLIAGALRHTLEVAGYILAANILLNCLFEFTDFESLIRHTADMPVIQIFICTAIGLIPNCGATILLLTLFENYYISFACLCGGLLCGAGVGLLALFRTNRNIKENIKITLTLFSVSLVTAYITGIFIRF